MRSRAGYLLGGILIAAGIAGAVAWLVVSLMRLGDEVDAFPRVPIPGEATVQLEARKYVLYYEGANADQLVPPFQVRIVDARTREPLRIEPYGGSMTYSLSGRDGSAQGTVIPTQAGQYAVRTDGTPAIGGGVSFGRSIARPILFAILGTFAIGGLLGLGGVALFVVTVVRRSRAKRAAAY